jgi:hypothetical protein
VFGGWVAMINYAVLIMVTTMIQLIIPVSEALPYLRMYSVEDGLASYTRLNFVKYKVRSRSYLVGPGYRKRHVKDYIDGSRLECSAVNTEDGRAMVAVVAVSKYQIAFKSTDTFEKSRKHVSV